MSTFMACNLCKTSAIATESNTLCVACKQGVRLVCSTSAIAVEPEAFKCRSFAAGGVSSSL